MKLTFEQFAEVVLDRRTKERSEAGATFLDEHCPGWAERIDTERLCMSSNTNDILGQLYGHYLTGVRTLKLGGLRDTDIRTRLGLTCDNQWGGLAKAWRERISERLCPRMVQPPEDFEE